VLHTINNLSRAFHGLTTPALADIEVLYKSQDYIIVNKHHDLLINANGDYKGITVQSQLKHLYPMLANPNLVHEFRFSHRLDFSTSGCLCISLNKLAANRVGKAFCKRETSKYYLALLRGHVTASRLEMNKPIGRDGRTGMDHMMCTADRPYCEKPDMAVTILVVLQRGIYKNYPATKVLLKPVTGRRHQLRVHCSDIGHTIVGDFTYSNRRDTQPPRMFLHAYRLVLPLLGDDNEIIDVTTQDPFTDSYQNWLPVETVLSLSEDAFTSINMKT